MNREVHVRFWEGVAVRLPRLLDLLRVSAKWPPLKRGTGQVGHGAAF